MLNKFLAVCLLVYNFQNSLDFYSNKLGMKVKTKDEPGGFAELESNGFTLAIFQKDKATEMFPAKYMREGGGVVIAFQVDNLQRACQELQNKGVKIFEGPKTTSWGQKVAYFKDPDDNIWEISEA